MATLAPIYRWRRNELGVINQSPCPDRRQSTADIKDLSCQCCFAAHSTEEKVDVGEKSEKIGKAMA